MFRREALFWSLLTGLLVSPSAAQELTPRTYWIAPVGTHASVFGVAASRGDFAESTSLPAQIDDATIRALEASYYRVFDLGGRFASLTATVPWADASFDGSADDGLRERDISGLGDASVRLAVNLYGGPTMDRETFQKFRRAPSPLLGTSLRIKAPTGSYDPDRLINLGSNRWSFKPEIGWVYPIRPEIILEIYAGVWFFTDNSDFMGQVSTQDPLGSGEIHLIYRIRPGFWVALDTNFFSGGRTTVDGVEQLNSQQNSRIGATVSIPFKTRNALRIGFSTPLSTDFGGDYETLVVGFTHVWGS